MSTLSVSYPPTPKNIDQSVLQPSPAFKQEVFKVLGAILFFIVVYFVLVAAALVLAGLCAFGGLFIIILKPMIVTLMVGLGLLGLGLMVVFFLLKFLFKRNKTDRSGLVEITETEQPQLFEFIRTLTRETQTPFPKKIYVSPEVNACVFYDSSFWSMFLPVRKNLQIGLGLVNSVNISEFKAILAHEFGHFSQRSMKLGSYVYNVNQVIYNMLYDNEGYGNTLESWANASGYFAFFAGLTVKIVEGIQWILRGVYTVVNKQYLSLSREMEFHADTVAAYVSGADPLINSLRRLDVANQTYNNLFEYYNNHFKEGLRPGNIYPQHTEIMKRFAQLNELPYENGLPQVNAHSFSKFNKTRVFIKDQWASHPTTDDREAHLRSLNIPLEALPVSAWSIFTNAEQMQIQITEKIYEAVTFDVPAHTLNFTQFTERYSVHFDRYKLNDRYKGYFDYRNISITNLPKLELRIPLRETTFEELLPEETILLPYKIAGLKNDIETLEAIQKGHLPVKSFEFSGQRHKSTDAHLLISQLQTELKASEAMLVNADEHLIAFFLQAAEHHGQKEQLRETYSELFMISASAEEDVKKYMNVMQDIAPIYHNNLEFSYIRQIMEKVKLQEVDIKERLKKLVDGSANAADLTEADRTQIDEYLAKDYVYFKEPNYDNKALEIFNNAMSTYYRIFTERNFLAKKELLEMQLKFI